MNSTTQIGNLGKTPQLRRTDNGTAVTTLALATDRVWTDRDGNRRDETTWHDIVLFGPKAENACEYLSKGSLVAVQGRLTYRERTDDNGVKRRDAQIIADKIKYLGGSTNTAEREPSSFGDDEIPF
jgi:single-strand DNA-binding protein